MIYEVDFTVQEGEQFETVQTALIHALSVTECRSAAKELADEIEVSHQEFLLDIREIEE